MSDKPLTVRQLAREIIDMVKQIPGYYNHCAVCGHTAGTHYKQYEGTGSGYTEPLHDFVMRDDEQVMSSQSPTWQDFWELQERVERLERQVIQLDSRPQVDHGLFDPNFG